MMMNWLIVSLLLLTGLIMLLADLFLVGVFVVGAFGVFLMIAGIVLSYGYFGSDIGAGVLLASILLPIISLYHILNYRRWTFMASNVKANEPSASSIEKTLTLGAEGLTLSALRPMGTAQFGEELFEVRTFGKYLDNNSVVYVAKIDRRKIYVQCKETFKAS